jgi:hypothetical protein
LERGRNRAHGRRYANAVRVVAESTLDAVSGRQKSVEALDQIRVAGEELGDSIDDTRGVNAIVVSTMIEETTIGLIAIELPQ